jgi:N-acetylmuramoyl-L-alanine amidase
MRSDIDTLARTLWGEARGEGETGMHAVANVIMNRVRNPRWWGNTVESVCLQPAQFTCWSHKDPNYEKLQAVTVETDQVFAKAIEIATKAIDAGMVDITGGADHYYNPFHANPKWALESRMTKKIGNHVFLRLEIPAPVEEAPKGLAETNTAKATAAVSAAGAVAVVVQATPAIEALGKLAPMVAVTIILVAAAGVLLWRWKQR